MSKSIYSIFLALVLLVPGSILITTPNNVAAQDDTKLLVLDGGIHDLNLKATMQSDGSIDVNKDFTIDAEDVVQTSEDTLMIVTTAGIIEKVKVVNAAFQTIELAALPSNYFGIERLPVGAYLLDIIVLQNNGDRLAFETVLIVLAPGQPLLTQAQTTNIIKTFIKIDVKIIFKDRPNKNDTKPPVGNGTEPSICYFEPNNEACDPVDGKCPEGFGFNDDGQCIPHGECPEGYARVDDDETGTCYAEDEITRCDNGAIVLKEEDCSIYDPVDNGTDTEPSANITIPKLPQVNYTKPPVNDTGSDNDNETIEMPPTPEPTDKCFPISAPVPEECEDVREEEVSPEEEDTPAPEEEEEQNLGGEDSEQNLEVEEEEEESESEESEGESSSDEESP
jgi:hypothetical protein